MNTTPHIMVAVDFSDDSARAFKEALGLAKRLGADIDLIHVSPPLPPTPADIVATDARGLGEATRAAQEGLAKLAAEGAAQGVAVQTHLFVGMITAGLLEAIEKYKPAMVVVGSHGKGAIARAFMGSVSETLCRRSSAPVLVIPTAHHPARAERQAWACEACGHILRDFETSLRCEHCGARPARWIAAPVDSEPADAGMPAVGETTRETVAGGGPFATSPGGVSGYDVNPELRVRY